MGVAEWLDEPAINLGDHGISRLEVLGDVTGLASVWWAAREHVLTWPVGILNSVLFVVLFVDSRLYLSAALQVAFLALGAYGWASWVRRRPDGDPAVAIRRTRPAEWGVMAGVGLVGVASLTVAAASFTDAVTPFWDSAVLVLSLLATYGQARKLLEFWVLFLVADVVSVPLYLSQGLLPTALVFAVFGVLCVVGLAEWVGTFREARR